MSGCSQQPYVTETLESYSQRLANVLEKKLVLEKEHRRDNVALPTKADNAPASAIDKAKAAPTNTQNIKLREFYNLPDCGIKPLIAERNTTMGKLHSPSQRYLYEVKLVNALNKCLELANMEEQTRIQTILNSKQQDKRNSWRTLIVQSKEIRLATSSSSSHFDDSESHDFAILSWQQLLVFSPDNPEPLSEEQQDLLEKHLKTISDSKTPAKLNNDSQLIANLLPQITDFLQEETNGFSCDTRKEKQKVEYLRNVFHLFFVEKIQPLTSNMNKWYYKLVPVLEALNHPLTSESGKNSLLQHKIHYDESLKQHVQFWQQLFKRCNVSPVARQVNS